MNITIVVVEPRGFEPLTSAVHRRHDGLQELSTGFKIPAKPVVSALMLFSSFQKICTGCCTVAARGWVAARLPLRFLVGVEEVPIAVRRAKSDKGRIAACRFLLISIGSLY
jgi:hypothetical protein